MSTLFKRNSAFQCFFCQSIVPLTTNLKNFKCVSCGCWNRYNDKGEIISDEPAMHEEHLNAKSFAKRGFPSKDQLPNPYGPGPFCHSCQTNQMLQVNLLSNYLPDPDSPEYKSRLEMLPAYQESLDARYPPICETCMPLVEDEIHRKDHMARVQALGGWLSKGKERNPVKAADDRTLFWWRLRGCLWALSAAFSIVGNISAILELRFFHIVAFLQPVLPFIVVVSLLWAAWDPTYAKLQHAQQQSRHVRVQGRYVYRALQVSIWLSRLICSTMLSILWFYPDHEALLRLSSNKAFFLTMTSIEILSLALSAVVLRIHEPLPVRLVDTNTHKFDKFRSATPAAVSENDPLAALSLSSNPVIISPIFGHPSLKGPFPVIKEEIHSEDMDWTPTSTSASSGGAELATETENWLRPQRFFAPEKPTGLEGLLESARIQDHSMVIDAPDRRQRSNKEIGLLLMQHLRRWGVTYMLSSAAFVVGLLFAQEISWSWLTKS